MASGYIPKLVWEPYVYDGEMRPDDFIARQHGRHAGRIMRMHFGPQKGRWQWAGALPVGFQGSPTQPNAGFEDTPRAAARMCERYWVDNGGTLPTRRNGKDPLD